MRFIGIDPGEKHTGFAVLDREGDWVWGQIGVIDTGSDLYRAANLLFELIERTTSTTVITEIYQVRPVGHQKFTQAPTVRLIGAMEYLCRLGDIPFEQESTGDPGKELRLLGLSKLFETWAKEWPVRSDTRWIHGRAAWRVLARYLLRDHPKFLRTLVDVKVKQTQNSLRSQVRKSTDLWAPTALLRTPHEADQAR